MSLSQIEISREALLHNLASLKTLARPGVQIAAVVKGNAYGHGLAPVVQTLAESVQYFQVDDIDELRLLRGLTDRPALVLGYVSPAEMEEAVGLGAEFGVFDLEYALHLDMAGKSLGKSVSAHLKIDALLGRLGTLPDAASDLCSRIAELTFVEPVGAYAHFANIEDTTDLTHAQEQLDVFDRAFELLRSRWPNLRRHLSATSGLMAFEQAAGNNGLVRLGIGLYGMYPSSALARTHAFLELRPVMRWTSRLAQVKTLPARHPVGYGLTYHTPREMTIGIVPQGYSDGYDRGLSNSGQVLVRGARCPVIGRVAMNMFAVDLTAAPLAQADDEVVLLGRQGEDTITAEEIASRLGTINYEITTRISPLLKRASFPGPE